MVAARALEGDQKPAEALAEYRLYLQAAPVGPMRSAPMQQSCA